MSYQRHSFHFSPFSDREVAPGDDTPLLFTSTPPGKKGRVTVFFRTRRTLRRRLGVHDLTQIDMAVDDSLQEVTGDEMKLALKKMTSWHYLFPPESANPPITERRKRVDSREFQSAVDRVLAV